MHRPEPAHASYEPANPEVTVALQGTLDTFALPDVLRLLASTKKTGRLVITGTRGDGSVWVDAGAVVGTHASGAEQEANAVAVLFELLRFGGDGSFTFEAGTTTEDPSAARAVEPLLVDAERQLVEWREIEAVVPSMDAWVSLVNEVTVEEIAITAARWKRIVAIGSGTSVGGVARTLSLGELDVCRDMKELVELGLVEVGPAPETAARAGDATTGATQGTGASWDPFSIDIPGVAPLPTAEEEPDVTEPEESVLSVVDETVETVDEVTAEVDVADEDVDDIIDDVAAADEMAKQLASLSPKAARAVAAAAKASNGHDRDAALAEAGEDDDEPINRGLLLKFLSSVKS